MLFFLHIILIGGHKVGEIDYCIDIGIVKMNRRFLAFLPLPLLVAIFPVKYPFTIAIISRVTPLVLFVVVVHDGRCKIFGI